MRLRRVARLPLSLPSRAECAALAAAAAVVAFALAPSVRAADDEGVLASGDAAIRPPLPVACKTLTALRIVPERTELLPGESRVFDVQARCKEDGRWYSVLTRPGLTLNLAKEDRSLARKEGTRSVFEVPKDLPAKPATRTIEILARYAPEGRKPLTDRARVRVRAAP